MSYINSTLFFEPVTTKNKFGEKVIYFTAKSKRGGAKAELFPTLLDNLNARERSTLMRYFKKINFSCSVHIKRKLSNKYNKRSSRK